MSNEYTKTLLNHGIPEDLAQRCSQILAKDAYESRTQEEQKVIDQAYEIWASQQELKKDK